MTGARSVCGWSLELGPCQGKKGNSRGNRRRRRVANSNSRGQTQTYKRYLARSGRECCPDRRSRTLAWGGACCLTSTISRSWLATLALKPDASPVRARSSPVWRFVPHTHPQHISSSSSKETLSSHQTQGRDSCLPHAACITLHCLLTHERATDPDRLRLHCS